jgi:integrase/recombinase XerD
MVEEFLRSKKIEGKSEATINTYRNALARWGDIVDKYYFPGVKDLIKDRIEEMQLKYAAASVSIFYTTLREYFNFLINEEKISVNPCQMKIKNNCKKKIPKFLTNKEVEKLLTHTNPKYVAICAFLLYTGLRVSEAVSLNVENLQGDQVKFTGKGGKEAILPLSDKVKPYLKELINGRNEGPLFFSCKGNRMERRVIGDIVNEVGLCTIHKRVSPHALRHTFATMLMSNKVPLRVIQDCMRHSNISTTTIYTHLDFSDLQQAFNSI